MAVVALSVVSRPGTHGRFVNAFNRGAGRRDDNTAEQGGRKLVRGQHQRSYRILSRHVRTGGRAVTVNDADGIRRGGRLRARTTSSTLIHSRYRDADYTTLHVRRRRGQTSRHTTTRGRNTLYTRAPFVRIIKLRKRKAIIRTNGRIKYIKRVTLKYIRKRMCVYFVSRASVVRAAYVVAFLSTHPTRVFQRTRYVYYRAVFGSSAY